MTSDKERLPKDDTEIITVRRLVTYVGSRSWVKTTLSRSLQEGENSIGPFGKITVKALEKESEDE